MIGAGLCPGRVYRPPDTIGEALLPIKSGCAELLGVFVTGRMPLAPQIPTSTKQVFEGYEHAAFCGLFAPTGTPRTAIDKVAVAVAVRQAEAQPNLQKRMLGLLLSGKLMAA